MLRFNVIVLKKVDFVATCAVEFDESGVRGSIVDCRTCMFSRVFRTRLIDRSDVSSVAIESMAIDIAKS